MLAVTGVTSLLCQCRQGDQPFSVWLWFQPDPFSLLCYSKFIKSYLIILLQVQCDKGKAYSVLFRRKHRIPFYYRFYHLCFQTQVFYLLCFLHNIHSFSLILSKHPLELILFSFFRDCLVSQTVNSAAFFFQDSQSNQNIQSIVNSAFDILLIFSLG